VLPLKGGAWSQGNCSSDPSLRALPPPAHERTGLVCYGHGPFQDLPWLSWQEPGEKRAVAEAAVEADPRWHGWWEMGFSGSTAGADESRPPCRLSSAPASSSGITGVTTSSKGKLVLAAEPRIPCRASWLSTRIDLAIDGADEVEPHFQFDQAGGRRLPCPGKAGGLGGLSVFVVVVDASKLVEAPEFGVSLLPVEVLPSAWRR